jgi:hypothetical protein
VAAGGVLGAEAGAAVGVAPAELGGGAAGDGLGAVASGEAHGGGGETGQDAPPAAGLGKRAGDGIEAWAVHALSLSRDRAGGPMPPL